MWVDLSIAETPFRANDRTATAMTINGTLPGPVVRLREGENVTLNVTNRLQEVSSIHWHGLLVPPDMDGVQSGTYWFHSHSGGTGTKGSLRNNDH